MAKSPGKIALYELINKARFKSAQQRALSTDEANAQLASNVQATEVQTDPEPAAEKTVKASAIWSTRPKSLRFYPDRLELCFSWQVVAIAILAFLAVLLVFFRLGQIYSAGKTDVKKSAPAMVSVQKVMPQTVPMQNKPLPIGEQAKPRIVEPMGDNVIVITSYPLSSHLEPVKQYYAQFGIATEIIKKGSRYLLVTQNRFNSVAKPGDDGYEMRKKIISIGANYKPPIGSGFESFGTKPFQDAYGMKLE
ncbi:MAG: hypothetical protein PHP01_00270 [Phycisphaerae bacterium]|nr:hypothetical protein [Phycisphaerae bacterium]